MANEVEIERMVVRMQADVGHAVAGIKSVQAATRMTGRDMKAVSDNMASFGESIDELGTKMSSTAGSFLALGALQSPFGFLQGAVAEFAKMESLQTSFKSLTGSAEMAVDLMNKLKVFAAETPFAMPELAGTAKQLIAFGTDARDVIPLVKQLGDVSAGTGTPIGNLAYLMGTLRSQGRAMTVDINQFAGRGIPIWAELAKEMFGSAEATSQVRAEVEKGKVTYTMVAQAFKKMSKEGGTFNNAMKDQSVTFTGLQSTMGDAVGQLQEKIGEIIVKQFSLKEHTESVSKAMDGMRERVEGMSSGMKTGIAVVATLGTGLGTLVVTWKVGSLVVGMLIGNLRHMWTTVVTLYRSVLALNAAAQGHIVITQQQTAAGLVQIGTYERSAKAILAMQAAYLTLAAVGVYAAIQAFIYLEGSVEELNKELEKSAGYTDKMVANLERDADALAKKIDDVGKADPAAAIRMLNDELPKANKQVEEYRKKVEAAEKKLKDAKTAGMGFLVTGGIQSQEDSGSLYTQLMGKIGLNPVAGEEAALADQRKMLEKHKAIVEELEAAKRGLAKTEEKLAADVAGVTRKVQEQIDTLGLSTDQKELKRLQEMGADIQPALMKMGELEAETARQKDIDSIMALNKSLREQAETFKMTAHEKRMYALATSQASAADKDLARQRSETVETMEYQKSIMEKGRSVVDRFKTPVERLADAEAELSEMFLAGAIDAETYTKAIAQAAEGVTHLKAAIEDASSAGSVAAAAKVAEYADMLTGWQGNKETGDVRDRGSAGRQDEWFNQTQVGALKPMELKPDPLVARWLEQIAKNTLPATVAESMAGRDAESEKSGWNIGVGFD